MKINVKSVLCPYTPYSVHEDVFTSIVPQKYEIVYDRLQQLIDEYYIASSFLNSLNSNINYESIYHIDMEKELEAKKEELSNLFSKKEELNEQMKSKKDPESFFQMSEILVKEEGLISRIKELSREYYILNNDYDNNNEKINQNISKAPFISNKIQNIVENIEECLQEIAEIKVINKDKDGNIFETDRFDNFEVKPKHIKKLYDYINIRFSDEPEENKKKVRTDVVLSILSYLRLRKAETKLEIKDAKEIVSAYKERKLLDDKNPNYLIHGISKKLFYDQQGFDPIIGDMIKKETFFCIPEQNNRIEKACDIMNVISNLYESVYSNGQINMIELQETKSAVDQLASGALDFSLCGDEIEYIINCFNNKKKQAL